MRFPRPYLAEGEIQVPVEAYETEYRARLRELRRELVLPGFRPGQVPMDLVMARHGAELLSEILAKQFLEALDKALEGRRLIGLPFYSREPEALHPQPPLSSYRYPVQVLVVPKEPLPLEGLQWTEYAYEPAPGDVELYQRHLQAAFGQLEPLEALPEHMPAEKHLLVRLRWQPPGAAEAIRLSWNTLTQPFSWSYLAGRKIGEAFSLPPEAVAPLADLIRAEVPTFSPLTTEALSVTLSAAAYATPLSLEELKAQLDFQSLGDEPEAESWRLLLDRHTKRILHAINTRAKQIAFLHAARIQLPQELVQYNYLIYLRNRQTQNGHIPKYEDYQLELAWQVLFASYAYNEPELAISDEEVSEQLWSHLRQSTHLSEETQALLERLEESEEERKQLLTSLLSEQGDSLRQSLQYERFGRWIESRFGPVRKQPLPANVLFLRLL